MNTKFQSTFKELTWEITAVITAGGNNVHPRVSEGIQNALVSHTNTFLEAETAVYEFTRTPGYVTLMASYSAAFPGEQNLRGELWAALAAYVCEIN